ncbi:uncharacterized protein [Dysidea avara]|uniref:uncharacterized protein n=1 Tax=Dysidea avara TaxID=196820 RepID=UPI0033214CD1
MEICYLVVLSLAVMVNSMTVYPGQSYTEGNCSGPVDYFLCNCLTSNTTIDIHLSSGRYQFRTQPFCSLENMTSVTITGSDSDDTIIECIEPFNIVFVRSRNIVIYNIRMEKCGDVVNDFVNQTVQSVVPAAYFGNGFRFAVMLYHSINVTITDVSLQHTLGYGIIAFNALGNVTLSQVHIMDTTFDNDPKCNNYDYYDTMADFSCSGSGLLFFYHDHVEVDSFDKAHTNLQIDKSLFHNNRNFLPARKFDALVDVIETNYYRVPIPIQGAPGIAIYYLQNYYDVNTEITNTLFDNNNGTFIANVAMLSVISIRGITRFKDCMFNGNSRIKGSSLDGLQTGGGISYHYLTLENGPGLSTTPNTTKTKVTAVEVMNCNFTGLVGRTLGAALHIEKISSDSLSLMVRIEGCNFTENVANAGSVLYAADGRFGASTSTGSLTVYLINVNVEDNTISSSASLQYDSSDFITGIIYSENARIILNCTQHCNVLNNQPSVFYGYSASITISGKATFMHNSGFYGGVLDLINTVIYFSKGSELLFAHNYATFYGGAIVVYFATTTLQTQNICPIQFVGPSGTNPIFSLDDLPLLDINITFDNNTAGALNELQSIYANVFYICSWYPDTLTQFDFDLSIPPVNGTRNTVYGKLFNFIPQEKASDHLFVSAGLPCPCDGNGTHDPIYCMTASYYNKLELSVPIIAGRLFTLSIVGLDEVGSVGITQTLYADAYSTQANDNKSLTLAEGQNRRSFFAADKSCASAEFTIYGTQPVLPGTGILSLSFVRGQRHEFHFNFSDCPIGFSLQEENGLFGCNCGKFFTTKDVRDDFHCHITSGIIGRTNKRSWLSVIDDNVEYTGLCLPTYCNGHTDDFNLTDKHILCDNNHAGRACGACIEGYSKVFGSTSCKQCSNAWLATILLYGLLGIILVFILFVLKLTVTVGSINGVIFFCNVMSINEDLFFNTIKFSFLRVFISLINLDLGFEMCLYNEMTQIAKTGLQFVFPMYLWLLMFIIIFTRRYDFYRKRLSSFSAVPVLATLILLSYSKLLRTTISVFSFMTIHYTSNESDYSASQSVVTWQPDPNIKYFHGWHGVLFIVSLGIMLLILLPFTFASTFPKVILRSKRMSHFFPLLDCFYAPYKDKYRFWLGIRLIVLVYLSGMESVLFSYQEASLLSGVVVVLAFAIVQAYIHPFKNTLINVLDLTFTGIFILLSVITLYLYPSTSGYDEVNIAVNVLGFVAFFFFLVVIVFHIHNAVKHTKWYNRVVSVLQERLKLKEKWEYLFPSETKDLEFTDTFDLPDYSRLRESFLEQL